MRLKKKKTLVARAKKNALEDEQIELNPSHYVAPTNSHFAACAVGCLIIPETRLKRDKFLSAVRRRAKSGVGRLPGFSREEGWHSHLRKEFGIPLPISNAAEAFFVSLMEAEGDTPAGRRKAAQYIVRFAEALPEKVTFPDSDDLHEFLGEKWDHGEGSEGDADRNAFLRWLRGGCKIPVREAVAA